MEVVQFMYIYVSLFNLLIKFFNLFTDIWYLIQSPLFITFLVLSQSCSIHLPFLIYLLRCVTSSLASGILCYLRIPIVSLTYLEKYQENGRKLCFQLVFHFNYHSYVLTVWSFCNREKRKVTTSTSCRCGETRGRIQDPRESEPIATLFFLALIQPLNIRRHILALAQVVLYISYACAVLCS